MGSPKFTEPLRPPDPEPPAVDAFLSAVDRAMNSTTLLLTAECEVPVTAANRREVLHAFLRSPLFERLMRAADARRDWHTLSGADGDADADADEPFGRPLLRAGFRATLTPLEPPGLPARLSWMLREAFSPYGHHYPAADAERLVRGFIRELLGADDGPAWSCAAVSPDFLRFTGYYSDEEPLRPVYFDGGDCDTATFVHRDHTFHLLLTNGSP
ncbi:hypothetical protein OHA37_01200 [Streptomyces sp. NBC_00335]|uniref:hypothetical protein n=1 Tax=unclassified Streptomyces TaxID=2593676 RepID=UPI0022518098|nr:MULTISPECIES: hypothetical protein [unclassified Streptomyces]MCX5402502.1 hypothetical protein [Streptomyces sp. NBC_00086]